ncbi:MAG TPA: hypothetical protein VFE60_24380 [Roseiarcus sp.]|jgi:hypothetical protein|nr:hypothetical protein [Roseiarcus sp.]
MPIRYADPLAGFEDRATAAIALAPDIAAKAEKRATRRAQRDGFAERKPRPSTGNPVGRPKLSPERLAESKAKRRAYMRDLMRKKRAKADFSSVEEKLNEDVR